MKRVLFLFVLAICAFSAEPIMAQPGNMEGNVITGTWNNTQTLTDLGTFRQFRGQRTGATGNGNFLFNPAPGNYGTQWTGSNAPNFVRSLNTYHSGGAFYYTGGGWNTDLQISMTNGRYYTWNFLENGAANSSIQILETTFNPVNFSSISSAWGVNGTRIVTVNMSAAPASGENVFIRYTTNGYTTSTLVQCSFVGAVGTATIPLQAIGSNVQFYAYSSNKSQTAIETDVTNHGQPAHDLATLNLSSTLSYTMNPVHVLSSAGTSGGSYIDYSTLKAAFDVINAGAVHLGTIAIRLVGNTTETASAALNQVAGVTSVSIQPAAGATRTISGSIAGPLIDLNGADNVTIDGLNTGGNALIVDNTSNNALAVTIRFIADASNNTLQNFTIRGSGTNANGGTVFFSTGTTTGNDDNNINNCTITSSSSTPYYCIYSNGTSATVDNSGNTIHMNNIQDYFLATAATDGAINLTATGNSGWTITNNKIFQSASRLFTAAATHSAISIGVGSGYTISGNTIGFANASGTGIMSLIGNSVPLSGTFPTSYTTTGTSQALRFIAINCAFTAGGSVSSIQNNTISGIAMYTSSGATTTNGIFCGINITSGSANIGTASGNVIGSTSAANSIYIATTTGGGTAVGIYCTTANTINIQNNTIGGIDVVGTTNTLSGAFTGIDCAGTGGVFTISSNNIGNTATDNIRTGYTVTGGNLSNTGTITSTTGTASPMVGIRCTATGATANISSNTLRGWVNGTTAGGNATAITSTGANTTSVSITGNSIGTSALGWLRYAFANSGSVSGISVSGATASASMTINNNDFRGITYSVSGTGAHTYISWNHPSTTTDNINGNTFTNLNVNTTGSVTFFSGTGSLSATGIRNVNNNSIVTAFAKTGAGGSVTLLTDNSSSVLGSQYNNTGNDFSNITLTGATTMNGWSNTDGTSSTNGPTKTISGNTFSNWTCGSNAVTVLTSNFGNNGSAISGNTINNITGTGAITGISIGASNGGSAQSVSNNTITSLISGGTGGNVVGITGGSSSISTMTYSQNVIGSLSTTNTSGIVTGQTISAGSVVNYSRNKIYDLSGNQTGTITTGLNIVSGTTYNINNNLIGDLRATAATGLNAIIGMNLSATATYNVYFNTVYLNATSSSLSTFGNTCINFSSTATTLNLRNNVLTNTSTPAQNASNSAANGIAACLRRSGGTNGTVPTNYNIASNNNAYWCDPTAGTNNHLTYVEGTVTITNPCNTVANMKAFMLNRDQLSVQQNPTFLSTTGSNSNFLHIDPAVATAIESGGVTISGITIDYDNDTRNATTPDIGADEFAGIPADVNPPLISYTPLSFTCSTGNRTLSGVTITDATGVYTVGPLRPRIYYRKNSGSYFSQPGTLTSGNQTNGTWSFNIVAADMGGLAVADVVSYYIIAQDSLVASNITSNPAAGLVATDVNTVITHPTTPNNYPISATLNGTYTVGAGGNYATLDDAFNAYNTSCLSGPVVFSLIDFSYPLPNVALLANPDASPTNTLTIKPTISGTVITGSSATAVIRLNGADYIIIDGSINNGTNSACSPVVSLSKDLSIVNSSTANNTAAIWLSSNGAGAGATNNVIKNCRIQCGVDQSASSNTTIGILSSGSAVSISTSNPGTDNNNNIIENNLISSVRYGIYFMGSGAAVPANNALFNTGNVVRQNFVGASSFGGSQIGVAGVVMQAQSNCTVAYNEVRNVGVLISQTASGTDRAGISFLDCKNSTLSHNKVFNIVDEKTFSAYGLSVGASNIYTTANTVANNMVFNIRSNGTLGDQALGLAIGPGVNDRVVYNTFRMDGDIDPPGTTTATGSACGVRIDPLILAITNLDFRNNIITMDVTSNTSTLIHHALVRPNASFSWGSGGSNYNDLYRNPANTQTAVGGTGVNIPYTAHTSLSDWQTASSQDANSIAAQPFFTSPTDLHIDVTNLNNALLMDLGAPVTGVTTDYDCATRSATTPDMGLDEFNIPSCTGTPVAGTASASPAGPFCGTGSTTVSVTGHTSALGITFQWISSVTGTPGSYAPVFGATSSSYTITSLSTSNYYRCIVTCNSSMLSDTSSAVLITVNPLPNVGVTPASTIFCGSGSQLLTASGASTYSWSPAAGLSGTSGTSVTATPTVTTTYTVTGTDGLGCQNTAQATITVSPAIPTVTATGTPNPLCELDSVSLTTTVGATTYTALSENFNAATNNWTTTNTSTGGTPANAAWTLRPNGYVYSTVTFNSNDATQFYMSNSDAQGSGSTTATTLQSPAFSLSGFSAATLTYYHYYRDIGDTGDSAKVEVSTNGINWTLVQSHTSTQGTPTGFVIQTVNLNAYAGQPTVYVRFNYKATFDWYWCIDNVSVTCPITYSYNWTSNVGGFTANTQNTSHTPTVSTIYTSTVTNQFGCTGNDTESVILTPRPTVNAGNDQTACSNSPYVFTGATASNTTGLLWTTTGGGTFTGTTTLTPTYTALLSEVGTNITFTLTGSGAAPCTPSVDAMTLYISPLNTYYQDNDGDGFGNLFAPLQACTQPPGYVADNTDCNDNNAALNPFTNWYADMDGDGVGSFIFLTQCNNPGVPGLVLLGGDCNDNNPLIPQAFEICNNGLDDDCNGLIDDNCSYLPNDLWVNATNLTNQMNAYPACDLYNGTLVNALVSSEGSPAYVGVGGGRDVWYKFTAPSSGVRIRVVPTGFNAVIELQNSSAGYIAHENANTAIGGVDILNQGGLTEGAVYYVGVRNYDNTAGGPFTICISPLMDSRCDDGPGTYSMCGNFKADYTGANSYTYNFTPTGSTPGGPTSITGGGQAYLSTASPLLLRYAGTYNVTIDCSYTLQDGMGNNEIVTVPGNEVCAITMNAQPSVEVRLQQRCGYPATLLKGSVLQGKPFVCGAVGYNVEFQQMTACTGGSVVGLPIYGYVSGGSSNINLSTVSGLSGGGKWYEVRYQPVFAYGNGTYGSPQRIYIGGAVINEPLVWNNNEEKLNNEPSALLYPNPNNGELLNLYVDEIMYSAEVRISDTFGRLVFNNRYFAEGQLNASIMLEKKLSSGLYMVEIIVDGKVITEKLVIE